MPRRFVREEWGGTETVVLEICKSQLASGLSPEIWTSMALANSRQEEMSGVPVRRFPYCYPFLGLSRDEKMAMDKKGGNLLSLSLFWSMMCAKDVRLYHAHVLKRLGGEVRTAARINKKPYVVSLHGGIFDVPEEELSDMMKPIENKFEWGRAFGALFGSRKTLDDADYVICVGANEAEAAKKSLPHDRVDYLPNGVDTEKFAVADGMVFRKAHGIPEDAFLLLTLSRLDSQKNQIALVEALAQWKQSSPEQARQARIVFIGPQTQPAYVEKLKARIRELNLDDQVMILPGMKTDDPQLIQAFHSCDVFVLPSRHEPFGIVVLEAWSSGKPVFVNQVGGLKTLVSHEKTGAFFNYETGGAEELAALLKRGFENRDWLMQMGEAGRADARQNYDWKQISARLEDIYQRAEDFNNQKNVGARLRARP